MKVGESIDYKITIENPNDPTDIARTWRPAKNIYEVLAMIDTKRVGGNPK